MGTGFFVHQRIASAIKRVEFVSDRVSYIVLRGRWCNIIILNVHAPSEEKSDEAKDGFYIFSYSHPSSTIFRLQKRIIRIMVGIRSRDSCRDYFKRLKILPLQSQYLLSLLLFVVDNRDQFKANIKIHNFNT